MPKPIVAVYADDDRLVAAVDRAMDTWATVEGYSREQVEAAFGRWLEAAVDHLLADAEAYATGGTYHGIASGAFSQALGEASR